MSKTAGDGPHILIYPYPAPGHIIPLLDLTHLLLTRGLTVTVLVTPTDAPLLEPLLSNHPSSSIQPLVLPAPDAPTSSHFPFVAKIRAQGELYDPILNWFRSQPTPPVAIISDVFLGWTHHLAIELGVPRVVFWPSCAFQWSISNCMWRDLPKRDDPDDDNSPISFPNIPNSPIFPWWQMSFVYGEYREGDPDWEFFRNSMLANVVSWGVVFNSFTELERVYIDHLKKEMGQDRVWTVGPLMLPEDDLVRHSKRGGPRAVPTENVMTWLDAKAKDSVVYVCFGSNFVLREQQMSALAAALECSGVHFIWCVKAADQENVAIVEGLADRVEGRGFVIKGWAPQVAILNHRAVGVFVTHCGWNSVLEGLSTGVMMLTWPISADQFTNAMLLVDQLGVAIRACEGGDRIVPDSAELSRLLVQSVGETRPERARVRELRDAALVAKKEGSSRKDLDEFVKQFED
ncbi:hypothetical protein F0562_023514 [Nyssa sinensis]|uniref:Glycosyltransferase n=1 Tax=Nyssa sinensis TaxID=561372 RepID=A0A5J5BJB1_9ASTE|nr:hypothetical protein F0562_023514 [Nyssa sinensis]